MNSEEGADVEVTNAKAKTEDNAFDKGTDSLANSVVTVAANNAAAALAKSNLSLTQLETEVVDYNKRKEAEWHTKLIPHPTSWNVCSVRQARPHE